MHLLEFLIIGFVVCLITSHTVLNFNVVVRIKTRVPFSIDCTTIVTLTHNTTLSVLQPYLICICIFLHFSLYIFLIKDEIKMTNRISGLFVTCKLDKWHTHTYIVHVRIKSL